MTVCILVGLYVHNEQQGQILSSPLDMNERDHAIAGWNPYGMNEQGVWHRAHRAKRIMKSLRYALRTLRYAKS